MQQLLGAGNHTARLGRFINSRRSLRKSKVSDLGKQKDYLPLKATRGYQKCSWLPNCWGMTSWCCPPLPRSRWERFSEIARSSDNILPDSSVREAQLDTHHMDELLDEPSQTRRPGSPSQESASHKSNFNRVKSLLRRLFLLNNYPHDTHEFLIGTDKLD